MSQFLPNFAPAFFSGVAARCGAFSGAGRMLNGQRRAEQRGTTT
ncbi:hypothetical protein ACVWYW_001253 [Ewingella americana]